MATVIDAEPIPCLPDLIDKIGGQQAWLTLDSAPAGDGKIPSIAGYRFAWRPIFVKWSNPEDSARLAVVIDTGSLDIPVELLIGETATFTNR